MVAEVLFIDDDPGMEVAYRFILESMAVSVCFQESVEGALSHLNVNRMPELIFLDCNLPSKSGLDFLDAFESLDQPCPVIGFSSHPAGSKAVASFESRVDHYLEKPNDIESLRLEFQRVLTKFGIQYREF